MRQYSGFKGPCTDKDKPKFYMRLYTGEKRYKCVFVGCGKTFKFLSGLKYHVCTHTGERPYKCPYPGCRRAFIWKTTLKYHYATHIRKQSLSCTGSSSGESIAIHSASGSQVKRNTACLMPAHSSPKRRAAPKSQALLNRRMQARSQGREPECILLDSTSEPEDMEAKPRQAEVGRKEKHHLSTSCASGLFSPSRPPPCVIVIDDDDEEPKKEANTPASPSPPPSSSTCLTKQKVRNVMLVAFMSSILHSVYFLPSFFLSLSVCLCLFLSLRQD